MREIRCRHCGYFLLETDAEGGHVRVTCRRCKRRQTVDLARDRPAVRESGERDAGREREAVACRT